MASMMAVAGCSQTLGSLLHADGIPTDQFTSQELEQRVNAADGKSGRLTYFVYLTVDPDDRLSTAPVLVKYDPATGKAIRHNLKPGEMENCCGSPLEIDFTEHYLLVSFHDNPSASTVMVASQDLGYCKTLYGFDFHEVTPDLVVYIESMVHFAPQHPERLAWADLRSGAKGELYPPKGDRQRAAFAALHELHMPLEAECQQANDPCDPTIYDEDIAFVPGSVPGGFAVNVLRTANHNWVTKGQGKDIPVKETLYAYKLDKAGWLYCEQDGIPAELVMSNAADSMQTTTAVASCKPNLPVVADRSGQ